MSRMLGGPVPNNSKALIALASVTKSFVDDLVAAGGPLFCLPPFCVAVHEGCVAAASWLVHAWTAAGQEGLGVQRGGRGRGWTAKRPLGPH